MLKQVAISSNVFQPLIQPLPACSAVFNEYALKYVMISIEIKTHYAENNF